ncbi:hypothetical protein MGYG_05023 [Nannizzia gypsea CBS 118893]|uniref:Uncharacterized protein n=1 Tax=Arthroderma gypseum (strain ATCC MYA-4604 / CBS 118893) TaxID=535722 RepID=E4UY28_ARTGP|nr:hypothetical protein MGYG_05023 [Nannizzia gypsea CBS 118893]EFR02021.1 hypothetical protein MGYG_05023 [Nannizzia gypsea CBS 118893]
MASLLPKTGVQIPVIVFLFILTMIIASQRLSTSIPRIKQFKGWTGPKEGPVQTPIISAEDVVIISNFTAGTPKPPGSTYTKALIVPRLKKEKVDWIDSLEDIQKNIYVVDDPHSLPRIPQNKGREAMVYLTYLIDNYDNLPEVMIFMHSHREAWHHEEPLNRDAAEMVKRLSIERVIRDGFMNLRCNWSPGCPGWIHPHTTEENAEKPEEASVLKGWTDIFPSIPIPGVIGGQCCAEFAISRERALAIPRSHLLYYRDWLLRTNLVDYYSGRVWEYLWHVIFTGQYVYCPAERVCFCDGYGLCFDQDQPFLEFKQLGDALYGLRLELDYWRAKEKEVTQARKERNFPALVKMEVPAVNKKQQIEQEIREKSSAYRKLRDAAFARGQDPRVRARIAGRPWKEGDGF